MPEIRVVKTSWDRVRRLAMLFGSGEWVFRGQADAAWPLVSSLVREGKAEPRGNRPLDVVEELTLADIASVGQSFEPTMGRERPELLALLQHHGCPTRLLDVSESFYVAAYFALCELNRVGEAAIWCIRRKPLVDDLRFEALSITEPKLVARHVGPSRDLVADGLPFLTTEELGSLPAAIVQQGRMAIWRPNRLVPRMVAQRGLFLYPTTPDTDVLQLVSRTCGFEEAERWSERLWTGLNDGNPMDHGGDDLVYKVVLRSEDRLDASLELESMNISSATLFPDLDGYCRSLKKHFRPSAFAVQKLAAKHAERLSMDRVMSHFNDFKSSVDSE